MTIDPVELKSLVGRLREWSAADSLAAIAPYSAAVAAKERAADMIEAATALLALTEEVGQTEKAHEADTVAAAELIDLLHTRVATAEADAKALRQRLAEIREIAGPHDMTESDYVKVGKIYALAAIQDGEGK